MEPLYWFLAAIVCLGAGVGLISVRHFGPEPQVTCVEEGKPTSGFSVEKDGKECPLSSEDFEAVWDYEYKSALPVRRAGAVVFLVGLGLGVTGIVSAVRRRRRAKRLAAVPGYPGYPGRPA